MFCKDLRESRLRFSDSLNGQRWIFLKKGLDDFRDGVPPSPDNMVVYGRERPVSISCQNSTPKPLSTALWKGRKKRAKMQVCLSKLSPLQQARRDYVAQIERCLNQRLLLLCPCWEKRISPKLLGEGAGVLDPEMPSKSKAGYSICQQENQPLQEVLDHTEDMQSEVTASKTRVHGKESHGKNPCTRLSKKVAARETGTMLADFVPPDEHKRKGSTIKRGMIKRATKHFCDWVMSLGGGNCSIDEGTLMSLLNPGCEREVAVPSPFHAVKFNNTGAEQSKSWEISSPQLAVRSSHHLRSLPCQVKVPSQTKWEKIRSGAWRKQKAKEPLKASEVTISSLGNAKNLPEKLIQETQVAQLHSTHASKEFLGRKGYRKPQFLPKMLVGRNVSRAPEETSKACKTVSEEMQQTKRRFFQDQEIIQISKFS